MEVGDEVIDIKLRLFGGFVEKQRRGRRYLVYEAGFVYWKHAVPVSFVRSVSYLRYICSEGFINMGWEVPQVYSLWFKERGKTWVTGKRRIDSDDDVRDFLESKHSEGHVELYQTVGMEEWDRFHPGSVTVSNPSTSNPSLSQPTNSNTNPNNPQPHNNGSRPSRSNTSHQNPTHTQHLSNLKGPEKPLKSPELSIVPVSWRSPRFSKVCDSEANTVSLPKAKPKPKLIPRKPTQAVVRRSPRFTSNSAKGQGLSGVSDKGKGKECKRRLFVGEESGSETGSSSQSDDSALDIDWKAGEEDLGGSEEDQEDWHIQTRKGLVGEVERSLQVVEDRGFKNDKAENIEKRITQLGQDIGCKDLQLQVEGSDSDELRSLDGSDEEEDTSPWFREDTDFKKPVVLVEKLKFSNVGVLRKALRTHAIENRYEFYYLHNGGQRITTFCRRRCNCEWNSKRSSLPLCKCSDEVRKCEFKVAARKIYGSCAWQIKELRVKHRCMRTKKNTCVTAEFLADKYVEEWRVNPDWKMKSFRARVLSDLGVEVGYGKAWLARARAKLMIYGSASEQYARVWDYGKAVLKWNPDSKVYIVLEGIDRPQPPLFLRMYCCLAALKSGFNKGCRPLIGLDGCHLKGSYPGQILVAVGKDGNNQIFPIAWATVEVENKDTWGWFLECLKKDVGDINEGLGLVFMSDRQKGLLEAFEQLVPNAEKRYCVRHIWANFKLQFTGSTFKELFWNAARSCTLFDFEVAMESIKFLSEDAYEYLANIPAQHWSRHAFSDFCKSNMILNNVCETFNAVIKDARDKPILTQMEWMRKYMMKRNSEKWQKIQKMEGKNTPYVAKVFERMEKAARYCIVQLSRGDSYEVELNGDKVVVDLHQKTCSCYHWQLTGIPCVHAFACILDKRTDPDDYVDEYYSMATYILAYQEAVKPMPGPKYWEKIDMPQPLPPPVRVMPGRPKSKKRKLEKGEKGEKGQKGESSGQSKGPKAPKTQKRCKNCGQLGHYAKTCGNEPNTQPPPSAPATAPAPTSTSEPKKGGKPVQNTPWLQEQRRKKAARAARNTAEGAGPWSIANRSFPQEKQHQHQPICSSQPTACTQQSQASTTTVAVPPKKQSKGKNKAA